jgi:hypothetical protein
LAAEGEEVSIEEMKSFSEDAYELQGTDGVEDGAESSASDSVTLGTVTSAGDLHDIFASLLMSMKVEMKETIKAL